MAVVIHSLCAEATVAQEPVERSSSSSSPFRCVFDSRGHVLRAQLIGHEAEHRAALGLLRLGQRRQVVPLVGHHLRQADADRPDGGHQRLGSLFRPAVRGPKDLRDPLLRLRLRGWAAGGFCHARQENRVGRERQDVIGDLTASLAACAPGPGARSAPRPTDRPACGSRSAPRSRGSPPPESRIPSPTSRSSRE